MNLMKIYIIQDNEKLQELVQWKEKITEMDLLIVTPINVGEPNEKTWIFLSG